MAITASRATAHGPSGFSLELRSTASLGQLGQLAWASMGSVTMRNASAAEAAVESCRNDLRECGMAKLLLLI